MSAVVNKGSILIYRAFDIGEGIDLTKASAALQKRDQELTRAMTIKLPNQGLIVKNPPLQINLGESILEIQGKLSKAETVVKLWDYGVLTVLFRIPIAAGTTWSQLVQRSADIEGSQIGLQYGIDKVAASRAQAVLGLLNGSVIGPNFWNQFEDYTVYMLESVEAVTKARDLFDKTDVAALVFSEVKQGISAANKTKMVGNTFQYQESDMVIVDWNSAVVVEPQGAMDVPDILEFALTQLLEMRYYDHKIERSLNELYVSMNSPMSLYKRLLGRELIKRSHEATRTYIDLTEFLERIQNSLKMVGDAYLATVFRSAIGCFRLQEWENAVNHKMTMLAQTSELIQGEANSQKAHVMELTVIALIAFEIIKSLIWG